MDTTGRILNLSFKGSEMEKVISNFRDYEIIGNGPSTWEYRALVDVTIEVQKKWFFSKKKEVTVSEKIARTYTSPWFFIKNGDYTPSYVVEALERSYKAKMGLPL